MAVDYPRGSLRASLEYEPRELRFGTSGRRGDVVDLTQLEIYLNVLAELEHLLSLPRGEGGIRAGEEFYYGRDLRPSSAAYVPEQGGRGEIAQAVERAIHDAGLRPVNLGCLPTPALTCYAIERERGSIMVTGSHIPFERNGYKTNTARGELLKKDEQPINERSAAVRQRLYRQPLADSPFDAQGLFKAGHQDLTPESDAARMAYLRRYVTFFGAGHLAGLRLLVYQHSAVGRDLLVDILTALGAEVIPAGRSDRFVPIDTENIDAVQLATIQGLANEATVARGRLDGVVSTDGDGDRPLVLGVEPSGRIRFFGGDLLGMIVAEYVGADAVVVPISCSDAIERGSLAPVLEPKTKIGSPYVIAGMEQAVRKGRQAVCGWEANGGFLTGSDIVRNGRLLRALPTRDATLPILCVLSAAKGRGLPVIELFERLPKRYSRAALLSDIPREVGLAIVAHFRPPGMHGDDLVFEAGPDAAPPAEAEAIRDELARLFPPDRGFAPILRLNYTDGLRVVFANGDIAHIRPSGNADELRIYAVADSQERAAAIAALGVAEPDGILRQMEQIVRVAGEG